jgi:hypothetical protein
MRGVCRNSILGLVVALAMSPSMYGQAENAPANAMTSAAASQQFDPRDFSGVWLGNSWHNQVGPGKGPGGLQNYASVDQKIPEPALTEWAKKNLLYKSISHDAMAGTPLPGMDRPGHDCPSEEDFCFSADQYGVRANDIDGEYVGKDCEPLSTPGIYDLAYLASLEFLYTPDGSRIFQVFEYHREWRTFWLNREQHPKDVRPTYEGDSIAHWEENTLVVDTVGYKPKTMISDNIGHGKSDTFRLLERFTLLDKDNLEIKMTFYDPKAWGDKSWPGFVKYYHRVPNERFREFVCSPRDNLAFENSVTANQRNAAKGK